MLSHLRGGADGPHAIRVCFFVDNATPKSIITTFFILLLLICGHIVASIYCPHVFGFKDTYFAIRSTEVNVSADLDVTLSSIEFRHRFCHLNGTLVRQHPAPSAVRLDLELRSRILFLKNRSMVNALTYGPSLVQVRFEAGSKVSAPFRVLEKEVFDYDAVQLKLTVTGDFDTIEAVAFRWYFVNPLADRFQQISVSLLSLFIGYALVFYVQNLELNNHLFTQIFAIVLGGLGVLASNPFGFLLPKTPFPHMSDHLFITLYIGVLRMFTIVEIELIRAKKAIPNLLWLATIIILFAGYIGVDALASFDRAQCMAEFTRETSFEIPLDALRASFHLGYSWLMGIWALLALMWTGVDQAKRLGVLAVFALIGTAETVVFQFSWPMMQWTVFTIIPQVSHSTVHLVEGAILLFLMRTDRLPEYQPITETKEEIGPLMDEIIADEGTGDEREEEEEEEEASEDEKDAPVL
jgi:hypothetical protein